MKPLSAAWSDAIARRIDADLPAFNPLRYVGLPHEPRRSTGMGLDDLAGWFREVAGLRNPVRRCFHLATLLSGSRPAALAASRVEHIDRNRRTLLIPKPKGGEKRAYEIPLSDALAVVLDEAREASAVMVPGTPFLFAADESRTGHIVSWREDRGRLSKWGSDLRQTYRNVCTEVGADESVSSILMNHSLGVHGGYLTAAKLTVLHRAQEEVSAFVLEHAGLSLEQLRGLARGAEDAYPSG